MLLNLILALNLFSFSHADNSCDEALSSYKTRIGFEQVKSVQLPNSAKEATEFLLKNQFHLSDSARVSYFLAFIQRYGFTTFDLSKVLKEVPHLVLNVEFNMLAQQRISSTRQNKTIQFRSRPWRSGSDLAADVLKWNFIISDHLLNHKARTADSLVSYMQKYQMDLDKMQRIIQFSLDALYSQQVIHRSQNDLAHKKCRFSHSGSCSLVMSWMWQNFVRLGLAVSLVTASSAIVPSVQDADLEDFKSAIAVTEFLVNNDAKALIKHIGLSEIKGVDDQTRCSVVQSRMTVKSERLEQLKNKSNRTPDENRTLEIESEVMKGVLRAFPECQVGGSK